MNINIGYAVILPFHDFHLRGQTNVYVSKHPFRQDIFKQTYRNVVFKRLYLDFSVIWCTYATLNTFGIKFMKLIIVWNISNFFLVCLRTHAPWPGTDEPSSPSHQSEENIIFYYDDMCRVEGGRGVGFQRHCSRIFKTWHLLKYVVQLGRAISISE